MKSVYVPPLKHFTTLNPILKFLLTSPSVIVAKLAGKVDGAGACTRALLWARPSVAGIDALRAIAVAGLRYKY